MNKASPWVEETSGGVRIRIKAQPRASKTEIGGVRDGVLHVKLTAPPSDGAANKHLVEFFSRKLKIAKSHIEILSGEKGRHKRLFLQGVSASELKSRLEITEGDPPR